jgi:hypothetical protein
MVPLFTLALIQKQKAGISPFMAEPGLDQKAVWRLTWEMDALKHDTFSMQTAYAEMGGGDEPLDDGDMWSLIVGYARLASIDKNDDGG